MCIVPCNNVIPQERREGDILDKMLTERSAVVNWALEGLHRLISNNFRFTACAECEEQKEEYRSEVDTLHRYLKENYQITGDANDRVLKTAFESDYGEWCVKQEVHSIGKRNIKTRMEKNGIRCGKVNGDWYYKGFVSLKSGSI
jgi:phage/plasmid-associated DNA primase